jgi:branched-subunit amino acid transport protein
MNEAVMILGMMLVTFGVRYLSLAVFGRMQMPLWLLRALRYVPVAVLTAISVPAVFMPQGFVNLNLNNPYLLAGAASTAVAWRTKNLLLTIMVGMGLFFLLKAVIAI